MGDRQDGRHPLRVAAYHASGLRIRPSKFATSHPPDLIQFAVVGPRGGEKAEATMNREAAKYYYERLGYLLGKDVEAGDDEGGGRGVEVAIKGESMTDGLRVSAVQTECPWCGSVGSVVRAHDEDGDVLLDTFVVAHSEFYDPAEACRKVDERCGPFLWEELQRSRHAGEDEGPGREGGRRGRPGGPEAGAGGG